MPSVRKAGLCNGSWAMAANAMMEVRTAIKFNVPAVTHLSDQQLIDCVYKDHNHDGCKSGWIEHAWKYRQYYGGTFAFEYGLKSDAVGKAFECNMNNVPFHQIGAKPTPWASPYPEHPYVLSDSKATTLMKMLNTVGPVAVAVNVNSLAFKNYSSGILKNKDMDQGPANHVMMLVGYKAIPDGAHFWILQNTWGTGWGDQGYVKIGMDYNFEYALAADVEIGFY